MPLWASIYILLTFVTCIDSLYDHVKYRERVWYTVLDVASDLIALLLFAGFWSRNIIRSFGLAAPYLFLFALLWYLCTISYDYRRSEQNATEVEKRIFERLGHLGLISISVVLVTPLFVLGGIATFRNI